MCSILQGFEQMYTLIPTVYRALLKSAVSGIGHRIHTTTKKKALSSSLQRNVAAVPFNWIQAISE